MKPSLKATAAPFIALAALAPPALAAPQPLYNCQTIKDPGAYEVMNNLESKGDCLVIEADLVTIDLGGYVLRGYGGYEGVTSRYGRGTTVRNGTITNFANGIQLVDGTIERVQSVGNANVGMIVVTGIVRDSIAMRNGNSGISVGPRSLVTGSVSTENDVGINTGGLSTLIGNTVGINRGHGILGGANSTIIHNTANHSGGFGISASCPSTIIGNTAVGNSSNLALFGQGCATDLNAAP